MGGGNKKHLPLFIPIIWLSNYWIKYATLNVDCNNWGNILIEMLIKLNNIENKKVNNEGN